MKRQLISKLMLLASAGALIWTGCSTTDTRSAATTPYDGLKTTYSTRPELSHGFWSFTQGKIMQSPAAIVDQNGSTLVVSENRLLAKAIADDGAVFQEGAGAEANISTDSDTGRVEVSSDLDSDVDEGEARLPFYRAVIR